MHDKSRQPATHFALDSRRSTKLRYLVHATVLEVPAGADAPDEALLGKLVRRRLSRLERVLGSHGGSVVRQVPQGFLAAFDTAEAAVLGACEMQRRCAVIPQISETQIALQIGIHPTTADWMAGSASDPAETTASGLATLLGKGSIVVSAMVIEALPNVLREKTSVLGGGAADLAAHIIDWDVMPMLPAPKSQGPMQTADSASAPTVSLVIRQGSNTYLFGRDQPVITIGRDKANNIAISDPKASRKHCRIIYGLGSYVLVDLSTYGTFIKSGDNPEVLIKKKMSPLNGRGQISFGHSCQEDCEQVFEFDIG